MLGAAYYIITESEWIVTIFDWLSDKWSSLTSKDKIKYSKGLGGFPDSAGDSDDDEKIVSSKKAEGSQRSKGKEDLEGDKKEATEDSLIDINKYS